MKTTLAVLQRLARYDGFATTSDLRATGLPGPTISTSLRRGVLAGLVERVEQQGAHNRYRLTDAGRAWVKGSAV